MELRDGYRERMMEKKLFGTMPDGREISVFIMKNKNGITASVIEFGAILTQLIVPDSCGSMDDIVAGYNNLEEYIGCPTHFGATIGRSAGYIAGASFRLNGEEYFLDRNIGENHLHGGNENGFHKQVWTGTAEEGADYSRVNLSFISPDGQGGYPGNLKLDISYTLTADDCLIIDYKAVPDKDTPVSLTHHSYFNLCGEGAGSVEKHELQILSDKILENKENFLVTGRVIPVKNTPMDFAEAKEIGRDIEKGHVQMDLQEGYAFYYVLDNPEETVKKYAKAVDPESGRCLEFFTDAPGVFLYTAEHLDGSIRGKSGKKYYKRNAFCLEPMGYSDAPNQPNFPSTTIRRGEVYRQTAVYKFSTL